MKKLNLEKTIQRMWKSPIIFTYMIYLIMMIIAKNKANSVDHILIFIDLDNS